MIRMNRVHSRPAGSVLFVGLLAVGLTLVLALRATYAVAPTDSYADAVNDSRPVVAQPENAVGAPNETSAFIAGLGASLTLDMGEGEEGTKTLRVYFGQVNANVQMRVEFLGANKAVILSSDKPIAADANPSTQDFEYDSANFAAQAYRYVRLSITLGAGVNVDAVQALGIVTNTNANTNTGGTNSNTNSTNTNTGTTNTNSNTNQSTNTSTGGTNNSTNSEANTNTTTATTDTDGDGMPDEWENAHGLNPNDANDANADPDGDYLTNLGEYRYGGDPNVADDLTELICEETEPAAAKTGEFPWLWIILAFLVGGGIGWIGKSASKTSIKSTSSTSAKK